MGQAIKGKGVVVGKAARSLQQALAKPQTDPRKAKKLEEAMEFHRQVKVVQ